MKKILLVLLGTFFTITSFTVVNTALTKATVSFQIKNLGINTHGSIGGLLADVHFNPLDLNSCTIEASVQTNTINNENSSRDEHLKSQDYFDVAHYPKITLKSISFKHKSGDNFVGIFNLTIKEKTKLVEIPFAYVEKTNAVFLSGIFKINRLDFNIGSNSLIMANEVTVSIDAETTK